MPPDDVQNAEAQLSSESAVPDSHAVEAAPALPPAFSEISAGPAAPSDSPWTHEGADPMEFPFDPGEPNRISLALESVLSLCHEFQPSSRWQHCCTPADLATTNAYITPGCTTTLAAKLLESCSHDDMVAANVFVRNENALQLNPKLSAPSTPLIALQDKNSGLVYDVLTANGLLSGNGLPAIAVLNDWITVRSIESTNGPLFLAFDIETVILLRSVGLPATLALGFDDITAENLKQLCSRFCFEQKQSSRDLVLPDGNFREPPESSASSAALDPRFEDLLACPRLVLVAWDVYRVLPDEPHAFRSFVAAFRRFEDYLDIDTFEARFWQVQKRDLDKVRFVTELGEREWTQRLFLELSFTGPKYLFLLDRATGAETQVKSFVEAVAQLHSILREGSIDFNARDRWNAGLRDYSRTMVTDLLAPLLSDVERTTNPVQRNTKAIFALLSSLIHLKMPLVYGEILSGPRNPARPNEAGKHIKELLAMTKEMLSLAREF